MSPKFIQATRVTFPNGSIRGTGNVLAVEQFGELWAVILDETPAHPVDFAWPDQPADSVELTWPGGSTISTDVIVAATDGNVLHLGTEIPVRKGTEGWNFCVAHILAGPHPEVGQRVSLDVNAQLRSALSIGHSACHLASLALNRAMNDRWTKPVANDALGSANFDSVANSKSRILPRGSVDDYRLGKSLRKQGFSTEDLEADLRNIESNLNQTLSDWIQQDSEVRIETEGELLTDRRYWVCDLPESSVRIACGGTHVSRLGELAGATATLAVSEIEGALLLQMKTEVPV